MTLSLQQPAASWDRTLPMPSMFLPQGGSEAYPHRSISLLQHHIVDNHQQGVHESYSDENGRRNTIAHIPMTRTANEAILSTNNRIEGSAQLKLSEHSVRKDFSVMSEGNLSRSSSPTSTSPGEGSNFFCLCQREPKIPRPRNAFILYRQHQHAAVVAQNPGLPNPDISKIIGEQWRQLPDKAKEEWKALAEDEKVRHSRQYPDYRYKPRRNVRFGGQSSISGPASASSESIGNCQKCGGKSMNTPHTPYTPQTPSSANMPPMNPRMSTAQIVSPPHSGRMRQYADGYGRPVPPPHDPRFHYAPVQHRIDPALEGPEPKKRRFNGEIVHATSRPTYSEHNYQLSPHERTMSNAMAPSQFYRSNMGPPARTGYPVLTQPSKPKQTIQSHRRDPSLTLPPLKTPLSQQVPASLSAGPQSQKSGVEAMIMSIPVLNKVKILSQIAPILAAPGPASPSQEVRGAIIAVEGMDPNAVYNMTNTLAEQLERDGTFAVRIFGGPDPYDVLVSSNRASSGEGETLSVSGFLDLISQWHKVSKEMQDYITKRPSPDDDTPNDIVMQEAARPEFSSTLTNGTATQPKSPVSAVSPKTITQAADISLKSPLVNPPRTPQQPDKDVPSSTPQPKSRIPASALAQAQADATSDGQSRQANGSMTPRGSDVQVHTPSATDSAPVHASLNTPLIPIAIVPHYQLTTVDASSIAMPITDAYSPHSHWQWLATLWRGCVGPDVTVIVQRGEMTEDGDQSAGTGRPSGQSFSNPPQQHPSHPAYGPSGPSGQRQSIAQQQQQSQSQSQQDVEVRLTDCRAVVVRSGGGKGKSDFEGSEWWEKAKRRVGFEVEEFLRR